jgi:hypothetical protein
MNAVQEGEAMNAVKKNQTKTAYRGPLAASGATWKEVRANLDAMVDDALAGDYQPTLLTYNGNSALVYREPSGWCYVLVTHTPGGKSWNRCHQSVGTRQDTIDYAAYHIIQNGVDIQAVHVDSDLPDMLESRSLRSDLVLWCRWQRAAKVAQDRGEPNVHQRACDHYLNPEFA